MKSTLLAVVAALASGLSFAAPIVGTSGVGAPVVPGATAVVDFEAQGNSTFGSLTVGDVTFTGIGGNLVTENQYAGQYNGRGRYYLQNNSGSTPGVRFDFANAVSAFAFNWGASDYTWTLSAFDSLNNLIESFTTPITSSSNAGEYIGLSGSGIKYATLTSSNSDYIFVDNFTIAADAGNTVPEPASLALVGLALAGVAVARKRK